MAESAKRGGARKGAGRIETPPDLYRQAYTIRLPAWLLDWLRERPESAGELVEQALCARHRLSAPSS